MATNLETDLIFTTQDEKTWRRKLYGLEALLATLARKNGQNFISGGVSLALPGPLSKEEFLQHAITALVHLRRMVPALALRCHAEPKGSYNYYLDYTVPKGGTDAVQWAMEALVWMDETMSLEERQSTVDGQYWNSEDGEYVTKIVMGPSDDTGMHFDVIANTMHGGMDGRGGMNIIDLFCGIMNELLGSGNRISSDLSSLTWGDEVTRLVPCSVLIAAKQLGLPASALATSMHVIRPPLEPQNVFAHPPAENKDVPEDYPLASELQLSVEETQRVRQVCKAHGYSVTAFLVALICVSEVDWTLTTLESRSKVQQANIMNMYDNAETVLITRNAMDQRQQLKGYSVHDGASGSPSCAVDGVSLKARMDAIRRAVVPQGTGIFRNGAAFWDVAQYCQDYLKTIDASLPAYISRSIAFQQMLDRDCNVQPDPELPGIFSTSVGDLAQIGIFTRWAPHVPSDNSRRIIVRDVCMSRRMPNAMKGYMCWQWAGQLRIRVATGGRWTRQEELDELRESWRRWVMLVVGA